jgi:saccharopine dehydrogenase (NAD+, L-lysine-forming)
MKKVLLIGAGGAGSVFARKCDVIFPAIPSLHVASRTLEKCKAIQDNCKHPITISKVDADNTQEVIDLIREVDPFMVVNLALPYQDLTIMDACLATGVHYLDTANYEPPDEAKFCYKWQWDYHEKFKEKGLMAVLGCGFDPGVTNIFCAHAMKNHFDKIDTVDIVDCNDGNHGYPFATNFNPEINIREITQRGKYYENGQWIETDPLSQSEMFDFPEVGPRRAYLMYHEELESLAKNIPGVKRIRFWMTFSDNYLTHLKVLQNVGMTGIEPVMHDGKEIIPIQFLKTLLPDPSSLAERYTGKTSIGCIIEGEKDGKRKKIFIYNVCDHKECYNEVGAQAISYTTGVPAVIGAILMTNGIWKGEGVFNVEQLDPQPFMNALNQYGLPWKELVL